ncbi:MAG: choice-of-anchor Q domain-containing protein [Gammaproteobacteria bacterium]
MNTRQQSVRASGQTVLCSWRDQLAEAARTPALQQEIVVRQRELLPKFAEHYLRLQALPRHVRRDLQRRWKRSLAGVALLLALGQTPALAATISVRGGCSLADAITAANTDNAIGGCTAGSGADTLVLTPGSTHTLTAVNNPTYGGNGLPVVTSVITIAGNGSTIQRSPVTGTPEFRLLFVADTGRLALQGLTLTNGNAKYGGSAVATRAGTVTITNCTITGNTTPGRGGGLRAFYGSTVKITNSTVSGNTAGVRGGGMYSRGTVSFTNSTVSGNTAGFDAGGVYNFRGSLTFTNSTVSGNSAVVNAGGVWNIGGRATLTNSTISGNSTGNNGGGLTNSSGIMSLINSTLSGNTAGRGGGVHSGGRYGDVRSDVVLFRTLISGNTAGKGAEVYQVDGGVISANHFNLFGHSGLTNAQAFGGTGLILSGPFDGIATSDGATPTLLASILDPVLASNGGLTHTHALVADSPAIDETNSCPPPDRDQRGVPRPQNGNADPALLCDVGAFERVLPGVVACDHIPATIIGTAIGETLTGTPGPDVIQGLDGNDVISGLGGNDVICGGLGNDRLSGGLGSDRLFGDAGTDRLSGGIGFDRCNGGPGGGGLTAGCEQLSNGP